MQKFTEVIGRVPIPICGLILALASLGNFLKPVSSFLHGFCGGCACFFLALILLRLALYPKMVMNDLKNPVIASASGTFPMALMVLSTYAIPFVGATTAYYFWLSAIALHITLMVYFTARFMVHLKMENVHASYFIVYVGIAVASVTAPSHHAQALGAAIFVFAFVALFLLAVLVVYRYIRYPQVAEAAKPLFCICAAPTSLCLAGYLQSVADPSLAMVLALLFVATTIYAFVLARATHYIQTLPFYPSYAGFTFPFVICPTAAYYALTFLEAAGFSLWALRLLVLFEATVGVTFVLYAALRYLTFLFSDAKQTARRENCDEHFVIGIFPFKLCSDSVED